MQPHPPRSTIDLHTHSTASDGLHPPAELVALAAKAGLTTIALTDHDTTEGLPEALAAGAQAGVVVIAGVELNTDLPGGGEAHVLGYELEWRQPAFQSTLHFLRDARERRGERMAEQLQRAGIDVRWERIRELAQGAVGRPHVARALIEQGYATDVNDAFARYLTPGQVGYVPRFKLAPEDAVRLIRSAGGVAGLAHPAGIPQLAEAVLPALVGAGLGALECYYGDYDEATVARCLTLALHAGLIPTGGSDYHGEGMHPTPLGGRYVPVETVARLREAAQRQREAPPEPFTPPTLPTQAE